MNELVNSELTQSTRIATLCAPILGRTRTAGPARKRNPAGPDGEDAPSMSLLAPSSGACEVRAGKGLRKGERTMSMETDIRPMEASFATTSASLAQCRGIWRDGSLPWDDGSLHRHDVGLPRDDVPVSVPMEAYLGTMEASLGPTEAYIATMEASLVTMSRYLAQWKLTSRRRKLTSPRCQLTSRRCTSIWPDGSLSRDDGSLHCHDVGLSRGDVPVSARWKWTGPRWLAMTAGGAGPDAPRRRPSTRGRLRSTSGGTELFEN